MGIVVLYQDLCREIDILELRINNLEQEYKFLHQSCNNGHRKPIMPLDMIISRMDEVLDAAEAYTVILNKKEIAKLEIEKHLNEFEGLEYKVGIMRDVKGMTPMEIAADLGYSYDYIRRISSRTRRKTAL